MADGTSVGGLHYDLSIDDSDLKGKLDAADKNVQQLGNNASDSFDKFQKGAKIAAVGLGVVGAGLSLYAKNATDYTENLLKSSKSLGTEIGVSTTEASRLVAAFGRMGIEASSAAQMFGIFSKQIVASSENTDGNALATQKLQIQIQQTQQAIKATTDEIAKNGDKTGELGLKIKDLNNTLATQKLQLTQSADAFGKLGVSVKDANGQQKDFNTILFEVADKFKTMPNGVDKTAIALQLFGRSGKDMVKVLDLGSAGIQDLEKQADRLGLTLNATTIASIEKLITSQKDLKQETDAMKIAVGTATAPVLTNFDERLNNIVQHLLNTSGPVRSLTIDFLAFGGPIAGAASGLIGFAANLDQALPILRGLGGAASGFIGLLQSPWIVAIAGAGLAIGALTGWLFSNQNQTDRLAAANRQLTTDTNALKVAQDSLAGAQLNEQGAALAVEAAQNNYNAALAANGPQSLQARQAAYDLAVAQRNLASAHQDTINKLDAYHNKAAQVAKDNVLISHLQVTHNAFDGVTYAANGAAISLSAYNQKVSETNAVGQKINLSPLLKRASGGPVELGKQYLTGEEGPELFIPKQSGTIIPANLTKKIMSGFDRGRAASQTTKYGDTVVNIGQINNDQDEAYVLRRLSRDVWLQSMGGSPAGGV